MAIGTIAALGGLAYSMFSDAQNSSLDKQQKKFQREMSWKEIQDLYQAKEEMKQLYQQRGQNIRTIYGDRVATLKDKVGQSLFDIQNQFMKSSAKTGFSYHGPLSRDANTAKRFTLQDYRNKSRTMFDELNIDLFENENDMNREIASINSQMYEAGYKIKESYGALPDFLEGPINQTNDMLFNAYGIGGA